MTIFAPLTGMLWRTLEAYGIDPRRVIKEEIYQPDGAFRMGARIPYSAYDQILEKAVGLINDPTVGLKSAEYLHPSHLGALGHAWLASSTLKTAIARAQRFSKMFDERLDMQIIEKPGVLKQ